MFQLLRTTVRPVTRKLAVEFTSMKPFPGDRPISMRRLRVLRNEMEEGRFHSCVWATVECLETGETYRINGKHTSCLLADPAVPLNNVQISRQSFIAETVQDVAECYQTFDDPISNRTSGDVNHSYTGCIQELASMPKKVIDLCVSGMAFCNFGDGYGEGKQSGRKERAAALPNNVPFVLFTHNVLQGRNAEHKFLRRAPVVAAMYKTFLDEIELAKRFWLAVRDGTNPDSTGIDRDLQKYLLTKNLNIGQGARGGVTQQCHVTRTAMYTKCMATWDKWRAECE